MNHSKEKNGQVCIEGFGTIHESAIKLVIRMTDNQGVDFLLIVYSDGSVESYPDTPGLCEALAFYFPVKDLRTRMHGRGRKEAKELRPYGNEPKFLIGVMASGNDSTVLVYKDNSRDFHALLVSEDARDTVVDAGKLEGLPYYEVQSTGRRLTDKYGFVDMSVPNPNRKFAP